MITRFRLSDGRRSFGTYNSWAGANSARARKQIKAGTYLMIETFQEVA